MPRLFGSHIAVILLASVLFYVVGILWYGVFFSEMWMEISGVTKESMDATMGPATVIGILISVLQVIGLAWILKLVNGYTIGTGAKIGVMTWFFFALPFVCYAWIYGANALSANANTMLMIDASHLLVAYVAAGATLGLMRKAPQDR